MIKETNEYEMGAQCTLHYCTWRHDESKIHMNKTWVRNMETNYLLTSWLGTQIGVPSLTTPASTMTPTTIGSRELKMNCGRIYLVIKWKQNKISFLNFIHFYKIFCTCRRGVEMMMIRTLILHGNTAIDLNSSRFFCLNSSRYAVNLSNKWYIMSAWKILTPNESANSCASRSTFTSNAKIVAYLKRIKTISLLE